jgi:hypothetical protein
LPSLLQLSERGYETLQIKRGFVRIEKMKELEKNPRRISDWGGIIDILAAHSLARWLPIGAEAVG